jgi:hypothetical protein
VVELTDVVHVELADASDELVERRAREPARLPEEEDSVAEDRRGLRRVGAGAAGRDS